MSENLKAKILSEAYDEIFYSEIKNLQSTLQARLNLLNLFKPLTNKTHTKLTLRNIDINVESAQEIINFLIKNSKYIESNYRSHCDDWFIENGTKWQKDRVLMGSRLKGVCRSE